MRQDSYEKAIYDSWRNCVRLGLCPDIACPMHSDTEEEIEQLQKDCQPEIAVLTGGVGAIGTAMPERTAFLLTNGQGVLIKKIPDVSFLCKLKEGISLAENCSGTNAVALALRFNESVKTLPEQHYCAFLSANHLYALPLFVKTGRVYLALITSQRKIVRELLALTKLMAQNMKQELSFIGLQQTDTAETAPILLSEKQRAVLLCMARGMTDKAVSRELGICIDTVKYHKRNLFRILGADCGVRAVVLALQKRLILLDEIASPTNYTSV